MTDDAESPKTLSASEAQRRLDYLVANRLLPPATTLGTLSALAPRNFTRLGNLALAADPAGHLQMAGLLYVAGYLDKPYGDAESLRKEIYPLAPTDSGITDSQKNPASAYEKALYAYLRDRKPEMLEALGAVNENLFLSAERQGGDEGMWRYDNPYVVAENAQWREVFGQLKIDAAGVLQGRSLQSVPVAAPVLPSDENLARALTQYFDKDKKDRKQGDDSNRIGAKEAAWMVAVLGGGKAETFDQAKPLLHNGNREDAAALIKQGDDSRLPGFLGGGKGKLDAQELTKLLKENGEFREKAERWYVEEAAKVAAPTGGGRSEQAARTK